MSICSSKMFAYISFMKILSWASKDRFSYDVAYDSLYKRHNISKVTGKHAFEHNVTRACSVSETGYYLNHVGCSKYGVKLLL